MKKKSKNIFLLLFIIAIISVFTFYGLKLSHDYDLIYFKPFWRGVSIITFIILIVLTVIYALIKKPKILKAIYLLTFLSLISNIMIFSIVYNLKREAERKYHFHKMSCEDYKKHLENSDDKIFVISVGGLGCDIEGTKKEYLKKYNVDVLIDCQGCIAMNTDSCKEKIINEYLKNNR